MKAWEQLISDTVQLGGVLVFVKDHAPHNLNEWLTPLTNDFSHAVPVVVRSVQDLLAKKFLTKPQDLIFLFEPLETLSPELNAALQGQRILLSNKAMSHSVDYVWAQVNVGEWQRSLSALKQQLQNVASLFPAEAVQKQSGC